MAITFKALTLLNENYYLTLDEFKNQPGVDCVIALLQTFMSFCEDNYLYSEALLDYFAMVRSTSSGKDQQKLTDALKDSLYYRKLQDVQNLPFKLTAREIQRGQQDGSILHKLDPMLLTLHGWTTIVGYIKVVSANGSNASPLFNVSLTELKALHLKVARALLTSTVVRNELNRID
jgi:hypothetical protein